MPVQDTPLRPAVFHILLALARGELHGLGIAEAIDDATSGAVTLGPGTLYRSLKEMARDGLIGEVPALKQVLILDTCQSGRIVDAFTKGRSVSSSRRRYQWRSFRKPPRSKIG